MKKGMKKGIFAWALVALLLGSMVVSSWAYWTQTQQAVNEFRPGKYSTKLVEAFVAPTDWQPGEEVNKDVKVVNNGTVPVFASIKISQEWIRRENVYDPQGNIIRPAAGEAFSNTFTTAAREEYAALIKWGPDVAVLAGGARATTLARAAGATSASLGLPQVTSIAAAKGKWLLASETPDADGNFTFYYIGVLGPNSSSPQLLDGVTLNPKIQAATLSDDTVWDATAKKWVTTVTKNPTGDYENAHFTLGVTMHTVQATQEAMTEIFGSDTGSSLAVISYLETMAFTGEELDTGRGNNSTEKKLFLSEINGKLSYKPATPGENWFMSHLSMLPGETYTDTLIIENQTKKDYTLFMQVVPRSGYTSGLPVELLELIHMKVYHNGELIYNGTALGQNYTGSIRNLQSVITLGKYARGAEGNIRVELELDKDTPLSYADMLTQIDWKFMVEEEAGSTDAPKTGDTFPLGLYIASMVCSGTLVVVLLLGMRKNKRKQTAI